MTKNAKPTYDAFMVDGESKDAFWTKIGAAWPHDDNKGFNIQLSAVPINGRVVLREHRERREDTEAKSREAKK